MKIRTKLILHYSSLSVILLILFSVIVVLSYIRYRQHEFKERLQNRANSTANLLIAHSKIDSSLLSLIDKNIITAMSDLQITIINQNKKIVYTNSPKSLHDKLMLTKYSVQSFVGEYALGYKSISFIHYQLGQKYEVMASAIDTNGLIELKNLLYIICWVLGFSLLLIVGFGFYSSDWSLKPFKKIIAELEEIDPALVKRRVSVQGNDELSQLAKTFNTLLDRIEQTFETEKSFMSNASHELRTPVTSILGQIEVGLNKTRTKEEYKSLLQSVYDDSAQMASIINSFLDLTEASLSNYKMEMRPVRIDEIIFSIVDDFKKRKPQYNISLSFDFSKNPDTDSQIECIANERQLRLMFSNIIDNACKYSENKKAIVKIDFAPHEIIVSITDHGIGIPKTDCNNIYEPFYRGGNTSGIPGHGIGLAIVKRIVDLHNASINIKTEVNIGTNVTISIKI